MIAVLLALGMATALVRAASLSGKYDAELQRLRGEWRTQYQALGLKHAEIYAKYPTPELALCRPVLVRPGGKATIAITGKFADNSAFLMENDQVQLSGVTATDTSYHATVTAAPDAVPAFGRLFIYTPVSGAYSACGAVVVGATQVYDFTAANGWKVKLTPQAPEFSVDGKEASLPYLVEYFKPGAATPFEVGSGSLDISASGRPSTQYTITTSPGRSGILAKQLEVVQRQLGDTETFARRPPQEQAAITAKLKTLGDQMTKEQEKADTDPAAARRREDEFGCHAISFTVDGANVTGNLGCSPKIGSPIRVMGTRK